MRRQPYPIVNLTGGLNVNVDPILLTDVQSPEITEVFFDKGLLKKERGKHLFGGTLLGIPMLYDTFYRNNGIEKLFCFTTTTAYTWNATNLEWEDITIGATVEDCEDVWTDEANVVSSVSTTDFKKGSKSLLLTIADAFTTGLASHEVIGPLDLTTYTHIHLWAKASVALAAGDIKLLLDDTAACTSPIESINLPALSAGVWTRCSLTIAAPASCGAIAAVGINVAVDKGAMTLALDDIRAVKEYTGTVDNPFFTGTLNDTYIITNGLDPIYKYTSGDTLVALGGSPPTWARTLCIFQNRIVLGGTQEGGTAYSQRIRWSSIGTTETWSGGTSGYIDLDVTPDWVMHIKLFKSKCLVYKDYSLWELVYVGGTRVFNPELKIMNTGCSAPNTIVDLGDVHVFFSGSGILSFDGTQTLSISKNIDPYLLRTGEKLLDLSKITRANSLFLEELRTYLLCFPYEELLFKYNFDTQSWIRFSGYPIHAMGYYYATLGSVAWNAATGSWAAATGSWWRRSLPSDAPTTLLGWNSGQTYEDDRVTTSTNQMTWVTKDFIFGHAHRITEVRTYYKEGPCTVLYSVNGGTTWTSLGTHQNEVDWVEGTKGIDITTQRIRFKVTSTAPLFELKWIEPWYVPRARSIDLRLN